MEDARAAGPGQIDLMDDEAVIGFVRRQGGQARYVTSVCIVRNRVTGGGLTAGIDFGLVLASRLTDRATAEKIQLYMECDPQPPFAAGSPDAAPKPVVEAFAEMAKPMLTRRKATTLQAAGRLGTGAGAA